MMDDFCPKLGATKEMGNETEAHIEASCALAFLEGTKSLLLDGISTSDNLDELETRLRKLEALDKLPTPAPSQPVAREDLAWRICRLEAKWLAASGTVTSAKFTSFHKLLPSDVDINIEAIEKMMLELYTRMRHSPRGGSMPLNAWLDMSKVPLDENKRLDIFRQHLFWLFGLKGHRRHVPYTKRNLYILAVELLMQLEASTIPPRYGIGIGCPPPPGGRVAGYANAAKKTCCGCCRCHCHPSKSSIMRAKKQKSALTRFFGGSRKKSGPRLGWMRRLFCWRRRPMYDDSDSSSASSVTWHD